MTSPTGSAKSPLTRRRALGGAAAVGLGVPLLAACGGDEKAVDPGAATSPSPASSAPSTGAAESTGGDVFAATSDIPVGGCKVYEDYAMVVTQPTEGEFKCFNAVCTHQGCLLSSSTDGVIPCGCHGSQFALTDGSVVRGPATQPLETMEIVVDGGNIALA